MEQDILSRFAAVFFNMETRSTLNFAAPKVQEGRSKFALCCLP